MITKRTKVQLVIFVIITLVGVSYVGARYARLDRLIRSDSYQVTAHFGESGGIFAGGEVTYRGVRVGSVKELVLTDAGVDVVLEIDNEFDNIPSTKTLAVVGNRSAIGEQYVELQPSQTQEPYLSDGSEIPIGDTRTPIQTDELLGNLSTTVASVDQEALRTTVTELGKAFAGTGEDLQTIIDTGNSFINAANDNFDVTTQLINDSNIVLNGQLATESSIRQFASQLELFSTTLAGADPDLRKIIDNGSFAANQLRTFLEENEVELADLLNNLVTTGRVVVKRLPGIQQVLVIYPYAVEGTFTVVSRSPDSGLYDAHFGMIITDTAPCTNGYGGTEHRSPSNGDYWHMNENARCTDAPSASNPRGAQNAPPRVGADYSPTVGTFDPETGTFTWGDTPDPALAAPDSVAPVSFGEDAWKWLYLQPMVGNS